MNIKKFFADRPYLFFISPALIILSIFSVLSIFVAFIVSFTDMDLRGLMNLNEVQFVGLKNFIAIMSDPEFLQAIGNTIFYVVFGVPLVIIVSLSIALLLDLGKNKIFTAARTMFYIPSVTTSVAVAVVWGFLYNTHYGLLNYLLSLVDLPALPWLNHPILAKISLIILAAWKATGLNMIIFLAALQGIPKDYYEAAEIDGASSWKKLIYIKIPLLKPAIFFVATTTIIGWFQFFEEPWVMTQGGPLGATNSMALFIYIHGFKLSEFGYAAAGSMILFIIIFIVTAIQFKFRKEEDSIY